MTEEKVNEEIKEPIEDVKPEDVAAEEEIKTQAVDEEKKWEERGKGIKEKVKTGAKRTGYFISIVINGVLLYIFNHLLSWKVPFWTEDFSAVLPVLNLSIALNLLVNLVWFFYDEKRLKSVLQLGLNGVGIYLLWSLLKVFPFDFSMINISWIGQAVRIAFIVGIVGTAIGCLVEIVELILSFVKNDKNA